MLFSGNLLKRYVNIKDQPENIANYLTLKTCEIEEIHTRKIPSEVVIGYVTKCEKHPDADKLFVTEVDCGDKGKYQIVT
jgi:phenylalanyl-tRNA synthetase beta chain